VIFKRISNVEQGEAYYALNNYRVTVGFPLLLVMDNKKKEYGVKHNRTTLTRVK